MSRKEKKAEESRKKSHIMYKTFEIFFLIIAIFAGIKICIWAIENNQNEMVLKQTSKSVTIENIDIEDKNIKKYNIDFNTLKETNKDTIAWIKVENTNIEYPVVKSSDNSYYLTHSFDFRNNSAGWIFMDYRNKADGTDKNIIIYGHNRKDGSMFGDLKDVFKEEWYEENDNKYITFITEKENSIYEIFSAYIVEDEEYYITTDFKTNEDFDRFIKKIKSRSFRNFETEIDSNDTILTLSTCSSQNNRTVVHAKKINR